MKNKLWGALALGAFLLAQNMEYNDELRRSEYCSQKEVSSDGVLQGQEIDALDRRICPSLGSSSTYTSR